MKTALALAVLIQSATSFVPQSSPSFISHQLGAKKPSSGSEDSDSSGEGFVISKDKTYGKQATAPSNDLIDVEGAMTAFFSSKEEWSPLFRSMAADADVPAMVYLGGSHEDDIEFDSDSEPWKRLEAMPSGDDDKIVIANFLDAWQQALTDIPVDEKTKDDADDFNFLEEGRRVIAISRFQVLGGSSGGTVEDFDHLFSTCWNELKELAQNDEPDTGSLIILPDYDLKDMRRFTDINLQRPLDWLGIKSAFEVVGFQRGSPAIRILYKLSDIPTQPPPREDE